MHNGTRQAGAAPTGMKRAVRPLGRLRAWSRMLAEQTQRRPGQTVALVFGAGFILGGGLLSPLTARILGVGARLGLRLLVLPTVVNGLGVLANAALAGAPGVARVADPVSQSRSETKKGETSP
jgi:hypothetical protein